LDILSGIQHHHTGSIDDSNELSYSIV